jgi:hypothetical protein
MAEHKSISQQTTAANEVQSSGVVAFFDKAFGAKTGRSAKSARRSTDFPVDPSLNMDTSDYSLQALAHQDTAKADNWIPRSALLIRVLWVVLILTLGVLTVFAGLMAHLVSGITAKVHEEIRTPTEVLVEPLPDNETLRDATRFAQLLEQRPRRRLKLELARLAALYEHGDLLAARKLVEDLSQSHRVPHYAPSEYVDVAEYNAVLGFHDRAWNMLDGEDLSQWPNLERRRAVALVGRLVALRRSNNTP